MNIRNVLMLSLLLPMMAACSKTEAPAPPAAQNEASAPVAEAAVSESVGAPVAEAEAPNNNPIVAPTGPALVPGTDYVVIQGGQPFDPLDGKIEVVEVFGYVCPACNAFQSSVRAWKAKLPADVRVTYVPAQFGPDWIPYAHAFYAAESLGLVDKTHDAVYDAIHTKNTLPGEGDKPTAAPIAAFYANYGVSAEQFTNAMNSFAINGKLNKAKQFAIRSQISGTPSLIVDGKYLVKGRNWDDMLRIADQLIAQERAAK
jgi:thiol:disulfide interchange protein DsbA